MQGIHFGIDETQNSFQIVGKSFDLKDSLKISVRGVRQRTQQISLKFLYLGHLSQVLF
jgi:hypothetical protein